MRSVMGWFAATFLSFAVAVPLASAEEITAADVKKTIAAFELKPPTMTARFTRPHGYVVFPTIGKGGLIVGGGAGDGHVFERGRMIGTADVTQITVGLQAGVQEFSEVIFFQDKAALGRFTAGKFELSANASAVVAKAGASGSADYRDGVVVFTMAKEGVMLEAAVGGQKFNFHPKLK
jgi:lipid-binding SYLF domain-containing protein